jgi:predicted Rossmann fold flavoprotein
MKTKQFDVIIIGAGASGLMCALQAGLRGKNVCVIDHSDKIGSKILISGGGKCNFTNLNTSSDKYICENKHFCKSALAQFSHFDFIEMIKQEGINYYEKTLGQLFCENSAKQIVNMLVSKCKKHNVMFHLSCEVGSIVKNNNFSVKTSKGEFKSNSLVVATGGLSIPKMGASNLGLKLAEQFGHGIVETAPALVPFTLGEKDKEIFSSLSGIAVGAKVSCSKVSFIENVLFTHRGISGPAILQLSSYWKPGQEISIHFLPELDWLEFLETKQVESPKSELKTVLQEVLPKRFVKVLFEINMINNRFLSQISKAQLEGIIDALTNFKLKPAGTEGYRKAEVTKGGVSTKEIDSKTMQSKKVKNLYFIGEVLDITGQLGGYNLQWAWSSGFVAGNSVSCKD